MEAEDLCHDACCDSRQLRTPIILPPDCEKQISVDPQSLKLPLKLPSCCLPVSASSLPVPVSMLTKDNQRHSAELPQPPQLQHGMQLRRSKSCGDGRASVPSDDFDIMSRRPSIDQVQNGVRILYESAGNIDDCSSDNTEEMDSARDDDSFKCSALCLFLPGISKKKPAPKKPQSPLRRQADENWNTERPSLVLRDQEEGSSAWRVASLEKFECASWASAGIIDELNSNNDVSGPLSYFDLPMELIRCGANETCSPVKAAFIFDNDLKGVLKKNTSRLASRKSCESTTRHVRFSTSAPTSYPASPNLSPCITPRLLRAREEFNALLEATGG